MRLFLFISLLGHMSEAALDPGRVNALSLTSPTPLEIIRNGLAAEGVVGEVHGSSPSQNLYVFTWRNPANFFDYLNCSLVPASSEIRRVLETLGRHDRIRIRGALLENRSPQPHIEITSLEIVSRHGGVPDYEHKTDLPKDLPIDSNGQGVARFLVHAVHGDGKILVLEFGDSVVPVYVSLPEQSRHLARNDWIELHYRAHRHEGAPVHLTPQRIEAPIRVIESAMAKHGQAVEMVGPLILFPQSPQVKFDVFAVGEALEGGLLRQYTLVNFDSPEVFQALREKCARAWMSAPKQADNARNKWIHRTLRVRVRGVYNAVDANQANVQIVLRSVEDLEVF